MFDGSFKSARKVNLSGRRKPTAGYSARIASLSSVRKNEVLSGSKEEFLLHNRLAREERQAMKLRATASLRIQAQYRRYKAAEQARIDVFTRLAQQVTQTVASQDIQYNPVPTTQLQLYIRQFLFARAIRNRVGKKTIRRMQDYVVLMLLVNSSRVEDPDSLVNVRKDATWVYQMARMCEIALETLMEDEVKTSMTNVAMAGGNPYVLLLEALIYGRYTSTRDGQIVQSRVLYYISVTARYSVFDAMSACIVQERKDKKARFETDLMVQLLRIASQTLQVSSLLNLSIRENAIRQVFASKMLLTPAAASSQIVHCVAKSVSTNSGLFWASIVQEWCNCSDLSILSWYQRVIVIGNVVELTTLCSFEQTLVTVVSYVLSELIRPSLCHWAFDVKGIEHKDHLLEDEDAMNDPEVLTSPRLFMTSRDLNVDKEIQDGIVALGESEGSVHVQWQLLCHSSFSARCLDILLRRDTAQMHDEKNAVALFCHTLSMILLSTGRSYVLNIAAQFTTPSAAIFALLSSMTVEQFGGTLDGKITDLSLVNRLWMWIKLTLESVRAQRKGYVTNQFVFTTSQMHVLLVLNVVYSHTLLGLDDETFYDKQWPLVLTKVMDVVTFLKQLIYETCWMSTSETSFLNDCMSENEVVLFSAVVSSIKLFNQLYDRDCRRPFMPESAWLWPLMPVVKEIVDLGFMKEDESRDAQAIFMLMTNKVASPFARAALILVSIPQVLSFNERVQLFQKLLEDSKAHVSSIRDEFSRALVMKIKRDEIVDMSFFYFKEFCDTMSLGALKLRMKIIFINEQGLVEAGIDGGGVFKEYMDCLTKNAFAPELGLFLETEAHLLYPNPVSLKMNFMTS
ncbi:hypothetical protein CCR75_004358 [Bremia lactucae]|uniref:HECT-type E3 ubiquitin transferase n=1 Tax=Bremia lactucae TaxID=4779 RepID=A0A976FJT8_BRELC|nr:hypothetical protein CCR75_004358 [Bremia lactucae]